MTGCQVGMTGCQVGMTGCPCGHDGVPCSAGGVDFGPRGTAGPPSCTFRASTMALTISSWIRNTSFSSRSKRSDQSWDSSASFKSRAVIRTLFPALRTLPSTTCVTPSTCPIRRRSSLFPLKANELVRDDAAAERGWRAEDGRASGDDPLDGFLLLHEIPSSCHLPRSRWLHSSPVGRVPVQREVTASFRTMTWSRDSRRMDRKDTINTAVELARAGVAAMELLHCATPIAALARRISSSSSALSLASVSPMRTRFRLPVNLNGTR